MIRNGSTTDAETIANIKIDSWRKTYLNIFPDSLLNNLEVKQETQKYLQNLKDRQVLVYEEDGRIIGYCYFGERRQEKFSKYSAEIFALYVKNDCQKRGIGTELLKEAIKLLSQKHSHILLWCAKKNAGAISFYKKNGLEIIGEEIENIGGKNVEKVALGISVEKVYNLKKSANYIENEENIAIYTNPDLIFLKNETCTWFKQIIQHQETTNVPQKFIDYLIKKDVIQLGYN